MRIGDARFVDLLRYVAWLVEIRHAPKPESEGDPYEKLKERARARNAALAVAGRDIGELPDVSGSLRLLRQYMAFSDANPADEPDADAETPAESEPQQ